MILSHLWKQQIEWTSGSTEYSSLAPSREQERQALLGHNLPHLKVDIWNCLKNCSLQDLFFSRNMRGLDADVNRYRHLMPEKANPTCGMASSPRQHTDLAWRKRSYHPSFPLPTSHFFWSLCSTNESRKSPSKQISLLLRAHPYCILHQAVNIALQYLLTNAPKPKQIPSLCCHFSPSSCSKRCFLLECSYTILGRPYWYTYEWVIEYIFTHTSQSSCHVYKLIFTPFVHPSY